MANVNAAAPATNGAPSHAARKKTRTVARNLRRSWPLYLLVLPALVYIGIFKYWPMYGVQIAFKSFNAGLGIEGSPWVGMRHFSLFIHSYRFGRIVVNTLLISVYQLIFSFPAPILFALLLNEIANERFKKSVQTITYMPHFLSTVVVVGLMQMMLSPTGGAVNTLLNAMGHETIRFMTEPSMFRTLYIASGIWQGLGWGSIIYIAAITGIDLELYEAAIVDGATKFRRMLHITIPGILPTVIIMLILRIGSLMSVGFDKVFLMQNGLTRETSEIISTYVYETGLRSGRYDYAAAIGVFNSVINFLLLIMVNKVADKVSGTSLW